MSSAPPPPPRFDRDPAEEPPPLGMVVCEVTGQTVPEDETVVFQGRRVSAEGKQILVDRVNAGEALPGELEDASRLARFGGAFLDNVIFGVLGFIVGAVVGGATASASSATGATFVRATAGAGLAVGLLQLVYFALMHARGGQTLGKMAAKSKVVTVDGAPIDSGTAWKRAIIYVGPNLVGQLPAMIFGAAVGTAVLVGGVLQTVFGLFVLVNVLLIFRASKRCLHDDLSGTRVVTTRA